MREARCQRYVFAWQQALLARNLKCDSAAAESAISVGGVTVAQATAFESPAVEPAGKACGDTLAQEEKLFASLVEGLMRERQLS